MRQQLTHVAVINVPSKVAGDPGVIFHNTSDNAPYYDDGTSIQKIVRQSELDGKQDELVAGSGISIVGNTISSTSTGTQNLFVSSSAPISPPSTYMWIQTGLGASGDDITFWIEDGQ